ncbi:MAG: hypothetical protein V1831_04295 [Candidatus Woesearchaeota archaeon]
MLNKKAQHAAFDELVPALVFIVVLVIFMLVFIGCSVYKLEKNYQETKLSRDDIDANKALTGFLEMSIDKEDMPLHQEKKVLDLAIESHSKKDYKEFNGLATPYFNEIYGYWQLIVFSDKQEYNSIQENKYKLRFVPEGEGGKAETKLIIKENEELTVSLFVMRE